MTHGEAQTNGKEIKGGEKKLETGKRRMIGLTEKSLQKQDCQQLTRGMT